MIQKNKQLLLCFSFLLLTALQLNAQNTWTKRESVAGSKRERAIGFAIGNRGYVGLGQDTLNQMLNDFWEFDPGTNTWSQKANFPAQGRRDAAAFAIGNKGYVGTGMNNADAFAGNTLSDFWEYDPATNTWSSKAGYPGGFGSGIYYATGFAISGKGYICCGKEGASSYSNELWEYAPISDSWIQKANFPGGVRYGGVAFVIGNSAYYGTGTDENVFNSDFYKYTPATNLWTPVATFPGSGRFSSSAFTLGGKGYMIFGSDGGYKDELWQYDPLINYWSVKASYPNGERRSSIAFTIGSTGYAGTGKGLTGTRRDFYEYSPAPIIGIDEMENNLISNLYPNPMKENAMLLLSENVFSDYPHLSFELMDVQGKIIRSEAVSGASIRIDRKDLTNGIYFIVLRSEGNFIASKKLIIQ